MVVCKCKKATKLYCFVHKVPVCGECICIPEHQICVVRTYSEWVIDGDYDWPPICAVCKSAFEGTTSTTRLGCLHVIHTTCLVQHLQNFPPHTAPAGYICPTCSTSIWPPKSIKDSGSAFHAKLKEAICQCDMGRALLANDMNYGKLGEPRVSSSPFSSDSAPSTTAHRESSNTNNKRSYISDSVSTLTATDAPSVIISDTSVPDIVEINDAVSINLQPGLVQDSHFAKSPNNAGPGATTRKGSYRGDKFSPNQSSRNDYDDESKQKYTRRGSLRKKFFRFLLPFWSSNMPTLPVTAPRKEDRDNGAAAEDESHRRRRRSSVDPRKILLFIAIMSCLATMLLLYYRLSQSSNSDEQLELEQMEQQ